MSIKDGRKVKSRGFTRKTKRAYDKCRKHNSCRDRVTSTWKKR